MSIGTFEKSPRGKIKIFWKNHGPSIMLKSASTLVIGNKEVLLFSQERLVALGWWLGKQLCWD